MPAFNIGDPVRLLTTAPEVFDGPMDPGQLGRLCAAYGGLDAVVTGVCSTDNIPLFDIEIPLTVGIGGLPGQALELIPPPAP